MPHNMPFGNTDKYNEVHLNAAESSAMNQLAARLFVYQEESHIKEVIEQMEFLYMYSRLRVFGEAFNASTRDEPYDDPFPKPAQEEGEEPEDYDDRLHAWFDVMYSGIGDYPKDFRMDPGGWNAFEFANVWFTHDYCVICLNHKDCPHTQLAIETDKVYESNTDPYHIDEFLGHYDAREDEWQKKKRKKRSADALGE
jgi:hypothetical protein